MTHEPNATPFLDVMLVLLVIYITSIEIFHVIRVQPHTPDAKGSGAVAVVLVAGPHETLWLDDRQVSPEAVAARVSGHPVDVTAQPGSSYRDVFHAVDVAHGAGASVVGLGGR